MSPRELSTRVFPAVPILFALYVTGCVGSIIETGEVTASSADAGNSSGDCVPQAIASESGYHKPGEACMRCHGARNAPAFTLGGTVYDSVNSDAPMAGVAVLLTDADGVEITLTTGSNGNFWTDQPLTFPVTTSSSSCPNTNPMFSIVQSAGADCNSAGCHAAGFRIHAQ